MPNTLNFEEVARINAERHRNSERVAAWRLRCLERMGYWPDRDIPAWRRVRDVVRVDRSGGANILSNPQHAATIAVNLQQGV